uniref:Uncharacterized protein n=1 Tax=Rhabditophanes sp. KR3021 TaxID=114890 RepID=A0AC35TY94_9BILA
MQETVYELNKTSYSADLLIVTKAADVLGRIDFEKARNRETIDKLRSKWNIIVNNSIGVFNSESRPDYNKLRKELLRGDKLRIRDSFPRSFEEKDDFSARFPEEMKTEVSPRNDECDTQKMFDSFTINLNNNNEFKDDEENNNEFEDGEENNNEFDNEEDDTIEYF